MAEFEIVRWFTEEDYSNLSRVINYHKREKDPEVQLSWLQKNATHVIALNEMYYISEYEKQLDEKKIKYHKVLDNNKDYEAVKNGETVKCSCGHNLLWVENYNFVGCTNYRDTSKEHNHAKNLKDIPKDFTWYEDGQFTPIINGVYLSSICKIIKTEFNIKIQVNNLFEFYSLNNVKLHSDYMTRQNLYHLRDSLVLSKKREILVKSILEENKIRFGYQKKIMYKIKGEKQSHSIPDFVAVINGVYTIIEQKKNINNISDYQVNFYKELIQFMHPKALIDIIYVIEEEIRPVTSTDTEYLVFNIDQFKKYLQ